MNIGYRRVFHATTSARSNGRSGAQEDPEGFAIRLFALRKVPEGCMTFLTRVYSCGSRREANISIGLGAVVVVGKHRSRCSRESYVMGCFTLNPDSHGHSESSASKLDLFHIFCLSFNLKVSGGWFVASNYITYRRGD